MIDPGDRRLGVHQGIGGANCEDGPRSRFQSGFSNTMVATRLFNSSHLPHPTTLTTYDVRAMNPLIRSPRSRSVLSVAAANGRLMQKVLVAIPRLSAMATVMALGFGSPAIAQSSAEVLNASPQCEALAETATFTGEGECVMENGDRYEGDFVDGQRTGAGRYEYAAGGFYIGGFLNGRFSGDGVFEAAQGHRYEGEFFEGQFNGQGTYRTADGNTYMGEFKNNTFHGEGTYTYADERSLSGMWEAGGYVGALPEDEPSEGETAAQESDVEDVDGDETGNLSEEGEKDGVDALTPQADNRSGEGEGAGGQARPDALAPVLER